MTIPESMPDQRHARALHVTFVGSLLVPLVLSASLGVSKGWYRLLFTGLAAAALLGVIAIPALARRGRSANLFLSLAVLNLFVLTPELVLRQVDFHYDTGIEFGFPRAFWSLRHDPELFWTAPPSYPGVNSFGFYGPEIETPKPAGVVRILFLGDSVPMQGYPEIVERLLAQARPGQRLECRTLALAGYTSYQGRVLAQKYGARVEPDLVFVSYGWNDHWRAWGSVDAEKKLEMPEPALRRVVRLIYERVRLLQWLRARAALLLGESEPLSEVRVPLADYGRNLTAIRATFAGKVPVVFLTAPTSHDRSGVPDYLITKRFAARKEDVLALHRAYNERVREVAATSGSPLLDLERELASLPGLVDLFTADGIHLTERGLTVVAERITRFVLDRQLPATLFSPVATLSSAHPG